MISLSLLTAAFVQILTQLFKLVLYSVRDRRLSPRYFFSAGGMPSAHAAFVTALTVAVGMRSGFGTDVFAVSFVFSAIVIFDAYRLRGAVQNHAKLLNRLAENLSLKKERRLNEMIGHTLPEIILGIVVGGIFSSIVTAVLLSAG